MFYPLLVCLFVALALPHECASTNPVICDGCKIADSGTPNAFGNNLPSYPLKTVIPGPAIYCDSAKKQCTIWFEDWSSEDTTGLLRYMVFNILDWQQGIKFDSTDWWTTPGGGTVGITGVPSVVAMSGGLLVIVHRGKRICNSGWPSCPSADAASPNVSYPGSCSSTDTDTCYSRHYQDQADQFKKVNADWSPNPQLWFHRRNADGTWTTDAKLSDCNADADPVAGYVDSSNGAGFGLFVYLGQGTNIMYFSTSSDSGSTWTSCASVTTTNEGTVPLWDRPSVDCLALTYCLIVFQQTPFGPYFTMTWTPPTSHGIAATSGTFSVPQQLNIVPGSRVTVYHAPQSATDPHEPMFLLAFVNGTNYNLEQYKTNDPSDRNSWSRQNYFPVTSIPTFSPSNAAFTQLTPQTGNLFKYMWVWVMTGGIGQAIFGSAVISYYN